jgi:hypothetical protein
MNHGHAHVLKLFDISNIRTCTLFPCNHGNTFDFDPLLACMHNLRKSSSTKLRCTQLSSMHADILRSKDDLYNRLIKLGGPVEHVPRC